MPHEAVDVVILTRDNSPLMPPVARAIRQQRGITLKLHRVIGSRLPTDRNRLDTIVRARNRARFCGHHAWFMFLDDDFVLEQDCIGKLLENLRRRPDLGAAAASFNADTNARVSSHVTVGATLFRRSVINQIMFRWESGRCECQCCCDDLRARRLGIEYVPEAKAWHIRRHSNLKTHRAESATTTSREYILAAFNRAHYQKFRDRFVSSLRESGNDNPVIAMTYGLHPSEVGDLRRLPNVTVVCKADAGVSPAIRRLKDFHDIIGTLSPETCVAYWDAGDVLFQTSLERLWHLVRQHAGKLLVVPEAIHGSRHLAVYNWTHTIYHKAERNRLYRLLRQNVYLNSGFAAGTAAAMSLYLSTAAKLSNSSTLKGTTDWGDQTAMNAYCHSYPERRAVISDDWNYTLVHRKVSDTVIDQHHVIRRANGAVIPVVHGAAKTLERYWLERQNTPRRIK